MRFYQIVKRDVGSTHREKAIQDTLARKMSKNKT